MALAYPYDVGSEMYADIAMDTYIRALNDSAMELKVREREPADIDTAYALSVRLEAYALACCAAVGNEDRHRNDCASEFNSIIRNDEVQQLKELLNLANKKLAQQDEMFELLKQLVRLKEADEQRTCNTGPHIVQNKRHNGQISVKRRRRRRRKNGRCCKCNDVGQVARNCPAPRGIPPLLALLPMSESSHTSDTITASRRRLDSGADALVADSYVPGHASDSPVPVTRVNFVDVDSQGESRAQPCACVMSTTYDKPLPVGSEQLRRSSADAVMAPDDVGEVPSTKVMRCVKPKPASGTLIVVPNEDSDSVSLGPSSTSLRRRRPSSPCQQDMVNTPCSEKTKSLTAKSRRVIVKISRYKGQL